MISRNTIVGSFFWKFLERISTQFISFLITIILARILLPSDYGIIALVLVFIKISEVFIDCGFSTGLIQKKNTTDEDFSTIFYVSFVGASCFYILLYTISPLISGYYENEEFSTLLRVLGISIFFSSFNSIQRTFVAKNFLFNKLFYGSTISVLVSGAIGIWLAYMGYGVWALVFQQLVSHMTTTLVLLYFVKWRPKLLFSIQSFKSLFDYSWKIFLTRLITTFFVEIRTFLIAKFYSPSSLAFYERGRFFPSLCVDNINQTIQTILFPVFSREQDNILVVRKMMRRSLQISSYVLFPVLLGLFATSSSLVNVLLTPKWSDAVIFVKIFSVASLFYGIQTINVEVIKSLGYSGVILKMEYLKKLLEIIILIISLYQGVTAIAYGVLCYNFFCIFINAYPVHKRVGYSIWNQLKDILPNFILSVIMFSLVWCTEYLISNAIYCLIIQILVGGFSYVLLSWLTQNDSFYYILSIIKEKVKS